jgi:hypothetical protein
MICPTGEANIFAKGTRHKNARRANQIEKPQQIARRARAAKGPAGPAWPR